MALTVTVTGVSLPNREPAVDVTKMVHACSLSKALRVVVTRQRSQKLADDGQWLLGQLVPKGAKPEKTGPSDDALVRNRLWTELNRRYDDLYKAGVEVWGGRHVGVNLPSLLSRLAAKLEPTPNAEG